MDLVEAKTICSKGLTPTMEFVAELLAERDRLRAELAECKELLPKWVRILHSLTGDDPKIYDVKYSYTQTNHPSVYKD